MFEPFEEGYYKEWRRTRIAKLTTILGGEGWFKGKEVLELAAGYGHIGLELKELGANVTFTDGRELHVTEIKLRVERSPVILLDQDREWNLNKKFDLIIHWGVLYHLDQWQRDLQTTMQHGDLICLESEIADTTDPNWDPRIIEGWYDGALGDKTIVGSPGRMPIGSRPSAEHVEKIIQEMVN